MIPMLTSYSKVFFSQKDTAELEESLSHDSDKQTAQGDNYYTTQGDDFNGDHSYKSSNPHNDKRAAYHKDSTSCSQAMDNSKIPPDDGVHVLQTGSPQPATCNQYTNQNTLTQKLESVEHPVDNLDSTSCINSEYNYETTPDVVGFTAKPPSPESAAQSSTQSKPCDAQCRHPTIKRDTNRQKKRRSYTLKEKLAILQLAKENNNLDKTARDLKIDRRLLQRWRAKHTLLARAAEFDPKIKTFHPSRWREELGRCCRLFLLRKPSGLPLVSFSMKDSKRPHQVL